MSSIVLDFAWSKPSPAELKAANVVAVGMYVSHDPSKNANLAVVKDYAAHGIRSFLFYEDAAKNALNGYTQGHNDATFAYETARAFGMPDWAPIVATADFDIPDFAPNSSLAVMKLGPVGEYFMAWRDVNNILGVHDYAAYGDYYLMKRLAATKLMSIGIQTKAWSGNQIDLHDITLLQNGTMFGGTADIEVIESPALLTRLAWIPGEVNPMSTPVKPAVPPGQWNNPDVWAWKDVAIVGMGLNGQLYVFHYDPEKNEWTKMV